MLDAVSLHDGAKVLGEIDGRIVEVLLIATIPSLLSIRCCSALVTIKPCAFAWFALGSAP